MRLWVVEIRRKMLGRWHRWVPVLDREGRREAYAERPVAWARADELRREERKYRSLSECRVKPWVRES